MQSFLVIRFLFSRDLGEVPFGDGRFVLRSGGIYGSVQRSKQTTLERLGVIIDSHRSNKIEFRTCSVKLKIHIFVGELLVLWQKTTLW